MILLVLGVLLWSGVHLLRGVAPRVRDALIARIGPDRYKGLFSLAIVASIVLMVIGWRSTVPGIAYPPPAWGRPTALILMLVVFILFAASGVPTNIKRLVRHPQLVGVTTWSVAHLLANGDTRSLVLFAGIGLWALFQIRVSNRLEGAWEKPAAAPFSAEIKPVVGGLVAYVILLLVHPYLFGVSPIGM